MNDRYRGALVGLALGDSLGAPYEFQKSPMLSRPPQFGVGVFGTGPGEPTDDSTLAVCAAEAMLEDADDFANGYITRLVRWAESGPSDIGNATATAVHWYQNNQTLIPMNNETGGNGSLMAVTPVILYYAENPDLAGHAAAAFARLTHPSVVAAETNRKFAQAMIGSVNGVDVPALVLPCEPNGSKMGWCRLTFAIATQALLKARDFGPLEALLQVIELGGDTDTNAAVAGALLGARYGMDAWPSDLLAGLVLTDRMIELADQL